MSGVCRLDLRLPKCERIAKRAEMDHVFECGTAFRFPEIMIRAMPNALPTSRLGIVVSRKAGPAVRRNRLKRLLREAYRQNRSRLRPNCDLVIVPRPGWRTLTLQAIEPVFCKGLDRINEAFAAR